MLNFKGGGPSTFRTHIEPYLFLDSIEPCTKLNQDIYVIWQYLLKELKHEAWAHKKKDRMRTCVCVWETETETERQRQRQRQREIEREKRGINQKMKKERVYFNSYEWGKGTGWWKMLKMYRTRNLHKVVFIDSKVIQYFSAWIYDKENRLMES